MKYILTLFISLAGFLVNAQTVQKIEGKTYTNNEDTWYGVNIPRKDPTTLTFKNNSITSVNRYGYLLQAGDEVPGSYNNNLDGAVITGNRLKWNGTPEIGIIPHGIFTGYNINVKVKYNYLDRIPMAIIRKSNGMTDVSGVVAYNIVKDPGVGVVVKGMNGVKIYNNTFYSSLTPTETNRPLIHIYENTDISPVGSATGTKIYNNIFYCKHQIKNISITAACLPGFESDYNIFYCESGTPLFSVNGSLKTFAEWQALGYDTHSIVINPDFKDLTSFVPKKRLDYGKNLGSEFATGLSPNVKWGTSDPATSAQNGKWQVGAIIHPEPENLPPVVSISLGDKGSDFTAPATIDINAMASDPDGFINKVEFYNGTAKLAESTTAPYSFTWKNVAVGTYSLKAVATDNKNSKTTSDPVTITVSNMPTSVFNPSFSNMPSSKNNDRNQIRLYPNPSNGIFKIDLSDPLLSDKNTVTIISLKGEILYTGLLMRDETDRQYDLSRAEKGNYIIMIKSDQAVFTGKFIKN
ncbi:MAG TPA: Ig-like domain-containing protein [Bacteroidales bacterium]|jgi:hypothetical protein|nr:Ig-like domain-containing protein [Bacteroidales bacterium]